jgi:hypothetical protein
MKITEHLVFAAMMVPTLLVLAAAAVSLGQPDLTVLAQAQQVMVVEMPADPEHF